MKGILLALSIFCFLMPASTFAVRLYTGEKYFKPLFVVFLFSVLVYAILFKYFASSSDLNPLVDFINGLLILFLLFLGFLDTVYTSFFTGFSTGILIQLLRNMKTGLTVEALVQIYQKGKSENPVVHTRLNNLIQGNYLAPIGQDRYQLKRKGKIFASLTRILQQVFCMGEGG